MAQVANILPEQTIGRGLRLMFSGGSHSYTERVDVIGNPAFLKFVEQLERDEDITLDTFDLKERVGRARPQAHRGVRLSRLPG
jgi:type III restriction enzyme